LVDYIRATVVHAGGITHLRKIAALAELHQVRTGCHGATDLSPVCMAAALHFDLSVHNFGIQEHMPHTAETDEVFPHEYAFQDGYMHPGDAPGLGVDIDEDLAAVQASLSRSTMTGPGATRTPGRARPPTARWTARCTAGEGTTERRTKEDCHHESGSPGSPSRGNEATNV